MPRQFRRRVLAVVAAWYALGGFATAAILVGTWVAAGPIAAGTLVGVCGLLAAVGLWRHRAWAATAVMALGVSGAILPIALVASARNSTNDFFIAAIVGGMAFLALCTLTARGVRRADRPAI